MILRSTTWPRGGSLPQLSGRSPAASDRFLTVPSPQSDLRTRSLILGLRMILVRKYYVNILISFVTSVHDPNHT